MCIRDRDQSLVAHDQTEFSALSPYLWSPQLPEYDAFVSKQLEVLKSAGWFNGASGVKVMAADNVVTRRATQQIVLPFLANAGITNASEYYIDSSNAGTLGATTSAALTSARSERQDHILTIGGSRVLAVALSTQEAQDLKSVYSVSSYDYPAFLVDNPATIVAERRNGMAGLGFSPSLDMRINSSTEPYPDPARPTEVLCKQIIDGVGAAPPEVSRENYRVDMGYCESTLLLKAALDKAPNDITPNAFRDAVWSLGTSWSAATTYGSNWQPGQYAGATVVRGIYWDPQCPLTNRTTAGCFRWGTSDIPLTPVTTTTPPAPAATEP